MYLKSFAVASAVMSLGLSFSTVSGDAATENEFRSGRQASIEEINECRNANTLIFQRASFFNQMNDVNTVFPAHGYSRRPMRGILVSASSTSAQDGRAATASLNHACEMDPGFRLKNPADQSGSYLGVKPRLDTPRAPKLD